MDDVTYDITDEQLREVDHRIHRALDARSLDGLKTLGFGELGVPLAWPDDEPRLCVKRLIGTKTKAESEFLNERIGQYVDALSPHVTVAASELRILNDDQGRWITYLIQPLFSSEHLVENILEATPPERDHPVVVMIRDLCVAAAEVGRAIPDSQFSNFAWDGSTLTFFDIGTPFLFHADGSFDEGFGASMDLMPAILRPLAIREAVRISGEMGSRRGVLEHAAISAARMGLDEWLDPIVATLNDALDDPLDVEEVREANAKRHKDMGQLKAMMKLQRAWATKVRRQPYDFFITDSWTGEIV
ncbi:MAG: DUF6206 family protein [Actinomycetota bacterium]